MSNEFESFSDLPMDLQEEAFRDAEVRLQAQLQIATAADQRALTWGGFLIASATAALGGGVALLIKDEPEKMLALISIVFAAALLKAAWTAISTVAPDLFAIPGNRPGNWLPDHSELALGEDGIRNLYRSQRAKYLDHAIKDNMACAERLARRMDASFKWALWSVTAAGVLAAAALFSQNFMIREPTSEIVAR